MNTDFDLGVRCGYFLSMKDGKAEIERDIFLGVKDGVIQQIVGWEEAEESKTRRSVSFIDASNQVVMPGLVNAHTHLAMTLFRGVGDDLPFHQWLFSKILPLEASLVDSEFVRIGTELAMLESIRFGVTTVCDMYFFAETIAGVIDQAGARAWIAQAMADGPMPEDKALGTDKSALFESFHDRFKNHPRITATLGPHAPYSCGDSLLKEVARLSEKHEAPIQIHLCETHKEVQDSLKTFGKTPVKRLHELGVLTSRTLCAHCVHFSDEDIELMRSSGASIAHNPDSNLKLGSGIAPIAKYRKAGVPVALGTDGAASNNDLSIFGVMDLATKLQKLIGSDNTAMVASDALACATLEGARALSLQKKIGSLELGKEADFITVDLSQPHLQPIHDIRSHLVYSTQGLEVDTVVCRGKVLMRAKEVLTLDQDKIFSEARHLAERIHKLESLGLRR